jgi:hypothetical protein
LSLQQARPPGFAGPSFSGPSAPGPSYAFPFWFCFGGQVC